jgi:hypothetical protein
LIAANPGVFGQHFCINREYNYRLFPVAEERMDYQHMIASMTPQMYQNLRRAVELGKWPDGQKLTPEQRENAMQAIIAWGQLNLAAADRVGYIDMGHKAGDSCDDPGETPLNWE